MKQIEMHTSNQKRAMINNVVYKIDFNTYNRNTTDKDLTMKDIARVTIRTTHRLMLDSYSNNRNTGSVIFINENTNETVAAGMII